MGKATPTEPGSDPAVMRYDFGLPVYRLTMAPPGLATAAQLRADRLSPAGLKPVAWLYYARPGHRTCPLYDRAQARPIRPLSERQRRALAEGRKLAHTVPCRYCEQVRVSKWGESYCAACAEVVWERRKRRLQQEAEEHEQMLAEDRERAARWAAEVLADPRTVVLDTETTGLLDGSVPAYAVEIAVVDAAGTVLLDTLLNPRCPIPMETSAIHDITDEMVSGAPTFADVLPELTRILTDRRVVIYNASFDRGILDAELQRHFWEHDPPRDTSYPLVTHPNADQWLDGLHTECAMHWYAGWYGEWHEYHQSYTWQPLNGGHRARRDCEATLECLRIMAETVSRSEAAA